MKEKKLSQSIKFAVCLFAIAGLGILAYLIVLAVKGGSSFGTLNWTRFAFFLAASIPCYVLLFNGLRFAKNIDGGKFRDAKNVSLLKNSGIMLLIDALAYLLANVVFAIVAQEFGLDAILAFVCLVGIAIGWVMIAASSLLQEDSELKKESEEII